MPTHNRIYIAPSHTKKIFGNMRRVRKGFSGRETPLFQTMVVQDQAEMGEGSANPTDPHHTPTFIQPSTSQPQKKQKPRKPKRKDTQIPQSSGPTEHVADEAVYKELDDSLVRATTTASSLEAEQDSGNIAKTRIPRQHLMNLVPKELFQVVVPGSKKPWGILLLELGLRVYLNILMIHYSQEILDLEKTKTTQQNEIDCLKRRVNKLEKKDRSRTHKLKRLYKVGLTTSVESSGDEEDLGEDASKQGRRINAIDADEDITLVNVQDDVSNEEVDENGQKKQKVEDDKETTELKQCLEIIPDEEEVTIDAIPLAVKSPSIVGWKIHKEGRKSYYQIMRADGKSQMYMIFSHKSLKVSMNIWKLHKLVKAKYKSTRPVEDLDLLLWGDLKTMFKPHVEDTIYMLVEKKYPLAPLTVSMMLEKKLQIGYESEKAYQLLKFIVKQLKK
ncbi:hypothetical protein Tco_0723185 [Tanacetum coccineum]